MRQPSSLRQTLLSYIMAMLAMTGSAMTAAGEVTLILSEDAAAYREVAESIRGRLADTASADIVLPGSLRGIARKDLRYLVAVGSIAAQAAVASDLDVPLLVVLLPRAAFERLDAERRRSGAMSAMSAVYLDQPIERQIDFIRLLLPDARRLGVLLGPESGKQFAGLQAVVADRRLSLAAQRVGNEQELTASTQRLLGKSDVLLALPDPAIFNAGTIQPILLATYRQRIPLIGFSASYVRAGAIASLHSTPAQIGMQAGDMLRAAQARGQLPPPRYPSRYTVATNPHVARSLGIVLESEDVLMQRMKVLEAR